MKVLVAVKRPIDPNVKVRVKADGSEVELNGVKMALNPFCEIAAEEAIRLKEKGQVSEVVVVSVGTSAAQEQLRTALALGADRALLVETSAVLEPLNVAKYLSKVIDQQKPKLILFGKQATDQENNQLGQMVAQLSGLHGGDGFVRGLAGARKSIVSADIYKLRQMAEEGRNT